MLNKYGPVETYMKKVKISFSLAFVVMVLVLSSCNDDETKSKTDYLTSGSWSFSAVAYRMENGTEIDMSDEFMSDCEKDNVITFLANGTYTSDAGADDCDGDSTDETGTWAWTENETVLAITSDGDTSELELISINSSQMKYSVGKMDYDSNGDGIEDSEVTIVFTLKAN